MQANVSKFKQTQTTATEHRQITTNVNSSESKQMPVNASKCNNNKRQNIHVNTNLRKCELKRKQTNVSTCTQMKANVRQAHVS